MTEIFFKDSHGAWPKTELYDQASALGGFAIGYFCRFGSKAGTGFVVKVIPAKDPCALILTAAHIFMEAGFQFSCNSIDFKIGEDTYEARPFMKNLDWDSKQSFLKDPKSKKRISVPDDWCLCSLYRKPGTIYASRIRVLRLIHDLRLISENMDCFIIGYPADLKISTLTYVAPEAEKTEMATIRDSLCDLSGLISSSGRILRIGELI